MELMEVPRETLTQHTYNLSAISFTPAELVGEIRKHYPEMKVDYKPDYRQAIGECGTGTCLTAISLET